MSKGKAVIYALAALGGAVSARWWWQNVGIGGTIDALDEKWVAIVEHLGRAQGSHEDDAPPVHYGGADQETAAYVDDPSPRLEP